MVEEGVDEGAIRIAGGGVDDDAVGFVDDEEIIVFEEDIEGDVLGDVLGEGIGGDGLGDDHGEDVSGFQGIAGFGGEAVAEDVFLPDKNLDAGAGQLRDLGCEVGIDAGLIAIRCEFRRHGDAGGGKGGKTKRGERRKEGAGPFYAGEAV